VDALGQAVAALERSFPHASASLNDLERRDAADYGFAAALASLE
jgi:hypothetical protein